MWESITITFGSLLIWGYVGGFDWVSDMIELYDLYTNRNRSFTKKITMSVKEYLNTVLSFNKQKAGPDVVITADFKVVGNKVKDVVKETVAMPGIKQVAIETLGENTSNMWVGTKKEVEY